MVNLKKVRITAVVLLAALIIACMPVIATASGGFSAYVKSSAMPVYGDPQMQYCIGGLPNKTIVTVNDYSGDTALITYRGRSGYARVSDMGTVESISQKAVTACTTYVFQQPNTRSAHVRVGSGLAVNVLAVRGSCAMVERAGIIGYMFVSHLQCENQAGNGGSSFENDLQQQQPVITPAPTPVPTPEPAPVMSVADRLLARGNLSNEEMIFVFAVKKMGYNDAAASGLLANIKSESGFNPNASGDSGSSYGICQWHAARKTRMIGWCEDNGYDFQTLEGQLYFLKYELEKYYPAVHKYLKSVSNDAQGAYDAAYYFCYHFEAPANRASKSNTRGNTAKNTYYPKYS